MKKGLHYFLIIFLFTFPNARAQFISTYAGIGFTAGYGGDGGPATNALLFYPSDLTFDKKGNLYIADYINNLIRKVDTFGIITTVAGYVHGDTAGFAGFSGDGGPATLAKLNGPLGLATDASGNIIFADAGNNRVRKIFTSGIIRTIAGTGVAGYSGNGSAATAGQLNWPSGIAISKTGEIYVADNNNHVVRRISTSGVISTVAGNTMAGRSGDGGPAIYASLNHPSGIAIDSSGNIFIADASNNAIRRIGNNGIISTIAGLDTAGYGGDGGQAIYASLDSPRRIAFDDSNNLFISDYYNNVVRKIDMSTGIISTAAGNGYGAGSSGTSGGYAGNDSLATNAMLFLPHGVAFDKKNRMFIADQGNDVVRLVGPPSPFQHSGINAVGSNTAVLSVYPNPALSGNFIVKAGAEDVTISVTNVLGMVIKTAKVMANNVVRLDLNTSAGIYYLCADDGRNRSVKRLVVE